MARRKEVSPTRRTAHEIDSSGGKGLLITLDLTREDAERVLKAFADRTLSRLLGVTDVKVVSVDEPAKPADKKWGEAEITKRIPGKGGTAQLPD